MNEALCPSVASVSDDKGATSRWKPYPNYKDSGIEWLGEIPEHWDIYRLKYCVDLINEKVDGRESTLPYIGLEHIEPWTGKLVSVVGEISTDSQANHFKPGDVLFGKLRPYLAKVLCAKEEGICTGELLVLRPTRILQCYLFNYMLTREWILIVDSSTYGAKMPRASWEFIGKLPVLVPPVEEQRAIAAFLDRETARIDAIIEKKQRQIELLQEKRTALISRAVTKGLNPDVKMKDSGIEWLGEVPDHWDVWKVTHGFQRLGSGTTPKSDNLNYYDGYIPWVTTSELRENVIEDTINKLTDDALRDYPALRLYPAGTLLFAMYGATIGRMGILGISATVNQACAAFTEPITLDPKFTYYWLLMRRPILIALSAGGGQPNLSQEDLRQLRIPAPPPDEQRAIAAFLDRETARIDALTEKIRKSIDLLREYHTAVISAVVTGKIDVRKEVS
ncbi:MAG: restriction endonuclease subunit S [Bacillota bacterium]